jgi:hypothetical protein
MDSYIVILYFDLLVNHLVVAIQPFDICIIIVTLDIQHSTSYQALPSKPTIGQAFVLLSSLIILPLTSLNPVLLIQVIQTTTNLVVTLRYIDPNTCYGSDYLSNKEDIHPDYIHLSLMDEVCVATTPAACAAIQNNLSLSYGNNSDGPMGPYIMMDS